MYAKDNAPKIALPRGWNDNVKSAMLHVISLAQFGMAYTHGWAANSINSRIRLKAKCERLQQQVAQLTEEIRIKDARMAQLDPRNRPHYPATERMAILLLRAARAWSLGQTARRFFVMPATVASWVQRVDEQGPRALVQLRMPVNRMSISSIQTSLALAARVIEWPQMRFTLYWRWKSRPGKPGRRPSNAKSVT